MIPFRPISRWILPRMDRAWPGLDRPGEGSRGGADPHGVGHLDDGSGVRRTGPGLQRCDRPAGHRKKAVAGSRPLDRPRAAGQTLGLPSAAGRDSGERTGVSMSSTALQTDLAADPLALAAFLDDRPWAMTAGALRSLLTARYHPDFEALAARMGRPLDGGRGVQNVNGTAVLNIRGPLLRYRSIFTWLLGGTAVEDASLGLQAALDDPGVRNFCSSVAFGSVRRSTYGQSSKRWPQCWPPQWGHSGYFTASAIKIPSQQSPSGPSPGGSCHQCFLPVICLRSDDSSFLSRSLRLCALFKRITSSHQASRISPARAMRTSFI